MIIMIFKMIIATTLYVVLTAILWKRYKGKQLTGKNPLIIGLIYGLCSIVSNHFSIDYGDMLLNVRDIGPLAAGLFFHPVAGILAGLIGGFERYIAGTYWNIGHYTRIACSVSTCSAGFVAAFFRNLYLKKRLPSPFYAFFIGAVMEVFHMYAVFFTHRYDMSMAFYVVQICAIPMIIFTALGTMGCSVIILILDGKFKDYCYFPTRSRTPLSVMFQIWLFVVMSFMLLTTFIFTYSVQTRSALQSARRTLRISIGETLSANKNIGEENLSLPSDLVVGSGPMNIDRFDRASRETRYIFIADENYVITSGQFRGKSLLDLGLTEDELDEDDDFFQDTFFGEPTYFYVDKLYNKYTILAAQPLQTIFFNRDMSAYETALADILIFSAIFFMISILIQRLVVDNLNKVNSSLTRITNGNLDEVVAVNSSPEFVSLSNDINQTVTSLKGYIKEAEDRIEEELMFARSIQSSSLPRVFTFPNRSELDLFASMTPAKEVGGDFYDFLFIDQNRIALVIADVSGKGIPAALFMMRGKTAIRTLAQRGSSPGEIFAKANLSLCEGNDTDMFITAWIGILDVRTGLMQCANAGHEYPVLMRNGETFELYKDKHSAALGIYDSVRFREYSLQLYPGDKFFVYTDGVPEAINHSKEQFGTERLLIALNTGRNLNMHELLPFVHSQVNLFANGVDQFDDLTMLGFTLEHLS